tara:strand:+ start:603 stop:1037 length:435 start_codon:yes stop_codon:yes gene_type:complete
VNIKLATTGPNVTKICKICGEEKYLGAFHANGTWTRPECKECFNYKQSLYVKLRKGQTAPEPNTPCECCGAKGIGLSWDHDHKTGDHRGWICHNCNTGIGKLGDNITGVLQALNYLVKAYKVDQDEKESNDFKEQEERTTSKEG